MKMKCLGLATAFLVVIAAPRSLQAQPSPSMKTEPADLDHIRKLLREVPLVDGHNDLPWQYRLMKKEVSEVDLGADTSKLEYPLVTDIPRLRAGGMGAQFWAAYYPPLTNGTACVQGALEQIDLIHRLCARYPGAFELAVCAADINRIHRSGKIASLIGIEGGHCINNSLANLRMMYHLGARYLTLTHIKTIDWADAAGDPPQHYGLTPFGKDVIREMNRLGMLVDLSHVTDDVMRDALAIAKAPVIFSHSSARAVCNTPRNVPDDILKQVAGNGGLVMVCFLPGYLTDESQRQFTLGMAERKRLEALHPDDSEAVTRAMAAWRAANPYPTTRLSDVANHIDHIRKTAGIDHVGIGSDFEGYHGAVQGLEDVSCYPALLAELRRRGYTDDELKKVAGLNLLRVLRRAEEVAAQLRKTP